MPIDLERLMRMAMGHDVPPQESSGWTDPIMRIIAMVYAIISMFLIVLLFVFMAAEASLFLFVVLALALYAAPLFFIGYVVVKNWAEIREEIKRVREHNRQVELKQAENYSPLQFASEHLDRTVRVQMANASDAAQMARLVVEVEANYNVELLKVESKNTDAKKRVAENRIIFAGIKAQLDAINSMPETTTAQKRLMEQLRAAWMEQWRKS